MTFFSHVSFRPAHQFRVCSIFILLALLLCGTTVCPSSVKAQETAGSLISSFNPGAGPNGPVRAVVYQPDGKVVIGGAFDQVQGTSRSGVARLNADGNLDMSFDPGTGTNGTVNALLLLSTGQILIGGDFTSYNNLDRNGLALLNSAGAVDEFFNPALVKLGVTSNPPGFVASLTATPDRQIIVTGAFDRVDDTLAAGVARLDNQGSLDIIFQPNAGPNGRVNAAALLPNGQIVIAGAFTGVDNYPRNGIARINVDGQIDLTFDPGIGAEGGSVQALALQPDGTVVLAGSFTKVNGQARAGLARLLANGSLDQSYQPVTDGQVNALALQDDGKLLLGGSFTQVNGAGRNGLARLNADGSLDTSFNPGMGTSGSVLALALSSNHTAFFGGDFTSFNGVTINEVAQVNASAELVTAVKVQTDVNVIGLDLGNIANVTIYRDGDISKELKVNYAVVGKAVSGVDYAPVKGVKKIKAGKAKGSFKILWLGTVTGGGQVTAKVKLLPGAGYSIVDPVLTKVKINR